MDNGLIFPYPCERAHGESVILTALKPPADLRVCWSGDARDLIW